MLSQSPAFACRLLPNFFILSHFLSPSLPASRFLSPPLTTPPPTRARPGIHRTSLHTLPAPLPPLAPLPPPALAPLDSVSFPPLPSRSPKQNLCIQRFSTGKRGPALAGGDFVVQPEVMTSYPFPMRASLSFSATALQDGVWDAASLKSSGLFGGLASLASAAADIADNDSPIAVAANALVAPLVEDDQQRRAMRLLQQQRRQQQQQMETQAKQHQQSIVMLQQMLQSQAARTEQALRVAQEMQARDRQTIKLLSSQLVAGSHQGLSTQRPAQFVPSRAMVPQARLASRLRVSSQMSQVQMVPMSQKMGRQIGGDGRAGGLGETGRSLHAANAHAVAASRANAATGSAGGKYGGIAPFGGAGGATMAQLMASAGGRDASQGVVGGTTTQGGMGSIGGKGSRSMIGSGGSTLNNIVNRAFTAAVAAVDGDVSLKCNENEEHEDEWEVDYISSEE